MKTPNDAVHHHIEHASAALTEGRVDDLLRHARLAADLAPFDDPALHMRVASVLQAAFRFSGAPEMFDRALAECVAVGNRTAHPEWAIPARALAGNVLMLAGRLYQAVEYCDAALALATACQLESDRVSSMAYQFRGYVLMEWNQLDAARDALMAAWSIASERDRGVRSGVARVMAELELACGDLPSAHRWSETLAGIVIEPMTLRNREWLAAVRARHGFAVTRDLRELDAWQRRHDYRLDVLEQLPDAAITARLHECEHLLTMLETTSQWTALGQLGAIIERGARPMRVGYLLRALTARALACEASGAADDALALWLTALELGEVGGFVRVYTDGSPLRLRLLRRAAQHPRGHAHARRVLGAAGEHVAGEEPVHLTDRQRDVLRLVASGMSDREISGATGLSVATVKTHLRAVYERLDVRSRTAAVAKASAAGLV